jgi:hypothetical protein
MSRSDYVVFVSAGMQSPKKRDHALARRQLYLNYGALTLATQLEHQDYRAILVHGHATKIPIFSSTDCSRTPYCPPDTQ